ncbi:hypothetical protein B0A52_05534 [Exophiala mesophila]|uniref:J domain-containing protein n=1 Tax=Exophiala mesophila TaxID=212818 RepID=A0A438N387_EXOME|nr:hypothetical protein B0A52_05534 [Exophiala mesophila]
MTTSAELKKQFYFLSKETHPDLNKSDPEASKRFAEISESYSVLSNPEKRKKYDRDVMRHHHMSRSHSGHHRHHGAGGGGSGSSYAGSRPASGLSKRRSIFKGPPPSFYAHGKPSDNTRHPHQHQHQQQAGSQAGTFNASAYADPGSWDPAFDSRSVFKTQTHEDYRRANRRAAELAALREAAAEDQSNFWTRFILVSGVIVLGLSLATLVSSKVNSSSKGGLLRADESMYVLKKKTVGGRREETGDIQRPEDARRKGRSQSRQYNTSQQNTTSISTLFQFTCYPD